MARKSIAGIELSIDKKHYLWIFLLLLGFTLVSRLILIERPQRLYFDEVYHGYTAQQIVKGDRKVYDPWAKHPDGVAYEWTHPPLGKLIIALGIEIFGDRPLGWRISSVLVGTGVVALTAILALVFFRSYSISLLSLLFASTEGLLFCQSRIAMIDMHFLFFMLFSVYFYYRYLFNSDKQSSLWASGVFAGFALATKWTGFYLLGILFLHQLYVIYLTRKFPSPTEVYKLLFTFCLLPTAIYFLSYFHYFLQNYTFSDFITLQKQMWWYHSGLKATHPYQSVPWQWVLNGRPVFLWVDRTLKGFDQAIYNVGNSIILIPGFIISLWWSWAYFSMGDELKKITQKNELQSKLVFSLLLFCYFLIWLPWTFSPRIMFFYHYTPSVPFLCILLSAFLVYFKDVSIIRFLLPAVIILSVSWFVLFFPHWTGWPVPPFIAKWIYYSVPGWR